MSHFLRLLLRFKLFTSSSCFLLPSSSNPTRFLQEYWKPGSLLGKMNEWMKTEGVKRVRWWEAYGGWVVFAVWSCVDGRWAVPWHLKRSQAPKSVQFACCRSRKSSREHSSLVRSLSHDFGGDIRRNSHGIAAQPSANACPVNCLAFNYHE